MYGSFVRKILFDVHANVSSKSISIKTSRVEIGIIHERMLKLKLLNLLYPSYSYQIFSDSSH